MDSAGVLRYLMCSTKYGGTVKSKNIQMGTNLNVTNITVTDISDVTA